MTRASLAEGDGILTALWTADDGLTYCNLSRVDRGNSDAPYSGLLIANSTAATSQFTGDVYCLAGDYLAVVYPATTFETNDSYTRCASSRLRIRIRAMPSPSSHSALVIALVTQTTENIRSRLRWPSVSIRRRMMSMQRVQISQRPSRLLPLVRRRSMSPCCPPPRRAPSTSPSVMATAIPIAARPMPRSLKENTWMPRG